MSPNCTAGSRREAIGYVITHDAGGGNFFVSMACYKGMKQVYKERYQLVYADPPSHLDGELYAALLSRPVLEAAAKAVADLAEVWTGFEMLDAKTCIQAAIAALSEQHG